MGKSWKKRINTNSSGVKVGLADLVGMILYLTWRRQIKNDLPLLREGFFKAREKVR